MAQELNGAEHINLYLPATYLPAPATVFRHTLYECRLTVLDSTADCQNSVTTLGRDSGSLEYVSTFFSEYAAYRIRLCPRIQQVAQPVGTSSSARPSFIVDCHLP